jgi:hypothetical protein
LYVPIKNGGFYQFDNTSILNTKHWLKYLTEEDMDQYEKIYEKIVYYLDTKPEMLDFDPANASTMKWFISSKILSTQLEKSSSNIKLFTSSKYYGRLRIFDYIGVKFFDYSIEDEQIN